jgi:hypothetical protein
MAISCSYSCARSSIALPYLISATIPSTRRGQQTGTRAFSVQWTADSVGSILHVTRTLRERPSVSCMVRIQSYSQSYLCSLSIACLRCNTTYST